MEAGENKLGPSLANVVGRRAGQAPGYNYSAAMKSSDIVWTPAKLAAFLLKPSAEAPGNKMVFSAKTSELERAAIVSYLQTAP